MEEFWSEGRYMGTNRKPNAVPHILLPKEETVDRTEKPKRSHRQYEPNRNMRPVKNGDRKNGYPKKQKRNTTLQSEMVWIVRTTG